MIHVQVRGIDVDFNENASVDFRTIQIMKRMKENPHDLTLSWDFVCRFFGEDQFCRILDVLEDTSFNGVFDFMSEIVEAIAKEEGEEPKN